MALILNIDTSVNVASISLSQNEECLISKENDNLMDQASWIQAAIADMMKEADFTMNELDAVAVSNGPGSYTGLRVGLSTAKGICYALKIPLITIGTLELMAFAAKETDADLLIPMIDARRMEVFTAVFDKELNVLEKPHALILDEDSFKNHLSDKKILFFGNGSEKFKPLVASNNTEFKNIKFRSFNIIIPAFQRFTMNEFTDLAYAEPAYIKDFYTACRASTTK